MSKFKSTPTLTTYTEWQEAYDFFNRELFEERLPHNIFVLDNNGKRVLGYFAAERFTSDEGEIRDVIAMNPRYFFVYSIMDIFGVLVHEMCHCWRFRFGKDPKKNTNGYHDREWGRKMESLGLIPSNTGKPDGKKVGYQMHHYILAGESFEVACQKLLAENFHISWGDRFVNLGSMSSEEYQKLQDKGLVLSTTSKRTRWKFQCPGCGDNAWGKAALVLVCGKCKLGFKLLPEIGS